MKRSWMLVMVLFVALLMVGCGKGKDEGKGDKPKESAPKAAIPQELSAKVVSTSAGRSVTSKVYMKAGKFRFDNEMAGGSSTIVRQDLKKVWIVMTTGKSYMEMAEAKEQESNIPADKMKGEVSRKVVGSETIDGHPTTKYEVTAKMEDKTMMSYQWFATDINFPVKTAAVDGSWSTEYRDIKIGGQPDSLFEVPAGYKKMEMPAMPAGRKGMMPGKDAKK
ncbi:MAG: DUF4412 domain-containing protein [Deltaproteobacteria bacterium]|nr:DUF4412 domain-containing protein [Deltaproteobacteria bacterium]